jgi:N-acetylmuramic acid 6-phosphate etherase
MVDYDRLPTEQRNPRARHLDRLSPLALVDLIQRQDRLALRAVQRARQPIAAAVQLISESLLAGGRLIYLGAGTSGRLGALDAAECPPTFGTPPETVVALIAGGRQALQRAVERAEDASGECRRWLRELGLGRPDVVCGITASGVTPFVLGGLRLARQRRCSTLLVTCGPADQAALPVDILIHLDVGPEVIAGSTRMKGGLATKATLHTLTTAAMIGIGKVYDNLMVDVQPTSHKLRRRAARVVCQLTGLAPRSAARLLRRAGGNPKVAAVMQRHGVGAEEARRLLAEARGQLRPVLERANRRR